MGNRRLKKEKWKKLSAKDCLCIRVSTGNLQLQFAPSFLAKISYAIKPSTYTVWCTPCIVA